MGSERAARLIFGQQAQSILDAIAINEIAL
jgi:hypothetical protein